MHVLLRNAPHGTPALRTPPRRGAKVIAAVEAQAQPTTFRQTTTRTEQPIYRGEGEEQGGEPDRENDPACAATSVDIA